MIYFAIIINTLRANTYAGCARRSFVCAFVLPNTTGVAGCDGALTRVGSRTSLIVAALPLSRHRGLLVRRLGRDRGLRFHLIEAQRGGCSKLAAVTPRCSCQNRGAGNHGPVVIGLKQRCSMLLLVFIFQGAKALDQIASCDIAA
jgi:hypothetical protein